MSKKNKNSKWIRSNRISGLAPAAGLALIVALLCALGRFVPAGDSGAAAARRDVALNEVMSKNARTLRDDYGESSDWIELINAGGEAVSLSGWMLVRADSAEPFVFPRETLQPGETLLIFASGRAQARAGYAHHAPFRLSASGCSLSLLDAAGRLVSAVEVPALEEDVSWARGGDGGWALAQSPTPGLPNDATLAPAAPRRAESPLRLNELMADNATYRFGDGCLCDWAELYNDSDAPLLLDGYVLTDSEQKPARFPLDGLSVPARSCLLIHLDGLGGRAAHADFGLNSEGEQLLLFDPDGALIDSVAFGPLGADRSLAFVNGVWTDETAPTPGLPNTAEAAALIVSQLDALNQTGVFINEVCAANSTDIGDHANYSYDWIELVNATAQDVDLTGWGLSDDPGQPRSWQFPAGVTIPAGGYRVILLSGIESDERDRYGLYNAPFSLSSCESVTLCTPDGTVVDRLPAMRQYGDVSCGRVGGQPGFFYFSEPSLGKRNPDSGLRARCLKPVISAQGGLFAAGETVAVEITAEPDARIFYTLDCSQPTAASTPYTGPITVNSTAVVRAVAVRAGSMDSYTATQTYFFGLSHGLRVVSLVADPDDLYSARSGIIANQLRKWERAANVEVYAADGAVIQPSQGCGLALNGDASRKLDMKSFRVLARVRYDERGAFTGALFPGRDYPDCRSFLLRGGGQDNSRALIRDPFITSLADATCVMYQQSEMCVLYLNGEFYGVYDLRERISASSICDFEGWPRTKNLDLVKNAAESQYDVLTQRGTNASYSELLAWIRKNTPATDANVAHVETYIDLDNFIDYMCFMIFSSNQDIGVRRYRSDEADGRWRWIIYDQDFGFYNNVNSIYLWMDREGAGSRKTVENRLFRYLMGNDAVVDRFLTRFGELMAGPWASEEILARLDALVESIRPEMALHCQKWSRVLSLNRWENHIADLRAFIGERPGKMVAYLTKYFKLTDADRERYFGAALDRIGR